MSTPTPAPAPAPAAAAADTDDHVSGSFTVKLPGDTTEEQGFIREITERLKSKIGVRGSKIANLDTASEDELAHTMARSVYAAFCEAGWGESHMEERGYVALVLAEAGVTNDNGTVGKRAFTTADVLIAAFREQTRQQRVGADAAKLKRQCVDDDATTRKRGKPSETETLSAKQQCDNAVSSDDSASAGQSLRPSFNPLRFVDEKDMRQNVWGKNRCTTFTGQGPQQAKKLMVPFRVVRSIRVISPPASADNPNPDPCLECGYDTDEPELGYTCERV